MVPFQTVYIMQYQTIKTVNDATEQSVKIKHTLILGDIDNSTQG